jgi:RNA polymerase sigma-70 factor, ECF subfamily
LQEVFLKVFEKYDKLESMDEKAEVSYLYKIASSKVIDFIRRERKRSLLKLLYEDQYVSASEDRFAADMDITEELQDILTRLKKLPPRYQEAISLRFLEELEYTEISRILDQKESTIRSWVSRGIKRMRLDMA